MRIDEQHVQTTKSAINRKLVQQILDGDPNLGLVVSVYGGVVGSVYLRQKGRKDVTQLPFVVYEYAD